MIIYQVQITLDPAMETEWLAWMRDTHIRDVLRTGCLTACRICRLAESEASEPVYVMQYECKSLDDYRRYRAQFAPALQKEHSDRFAGHFRGARQLLEEIETICAGGK